MNDQECLLAEKLFAIELVGKAGKVKVYQNFLTGGSSNEINPHFTKAYDIRVEINE